MLTYRAGRSDPQTQRVCVVLENGKIVGSVSQQHLQVNPEIGLFSKLFGKSNPIRSFMFAFTGPHTVLVQAKGIAANGDEINCLVTLKLEITRESAPRLITFPAKGTMTVQAKNIADVVGPAVQATVLQHFGSMDAATMRTVQANEDGMFGVKTGLRAILDEHGLAYRGGFITWGTTAAQQQLQHQYDLERLQLSKEFEAGQQAIELDHHIKTEQRKHEVTARMALAGVQAKEAAELKLELERLSAQGALICNNGNKNNSCGTNNRKRTRTPPSKTHKARSKSQNYKRNANGSSQQPNTRSTRTK